MTTNDLAMMEAPRRGARERLIYAAAFAAGLLPCVEPELFDAHWSVAAALGLTAMLWATRGLARTV